MTLAEISLTLPFHNGHCLIPIEIGAPGNPPGSQLPPEWVPVVAVINTGVRDCLVTPRVATRLKLVHRGEVKVDQSERRGYDTSATAFSVRVHMDAGSTFETNVRGAIDELPDGVDAMIGLELLECGVFTIDGPAKSWRLVLPGYPGKHTTSIPQWEQDELSAAQKRKRNG